MSRSTRQRKRLLRGGYLLLLLAVLAYAATWSGYRAWRSGDDAVARVVATLAAVEPVVADERELAGTLVTLRGQAAAVAAGEHPFAAPSAQQEPIVGPDGVAIPPEDPRYALLAARRDRVRAASGDGAQPDAGDDLADLSPEAALARVVATFAGRLEHYGAWLADEAAASAERQAEPDPAIAARIAGHRSRAADAARLAASLEAQVEPLHDPAAWAREVRLYATLWSLIAAALPLGGGALCYYLGRLRGRERSWRDEGLPGARARLWRQQRDLQYNGFGSYGLHVLLLVLPFLGFHCAYDLGPPGGGGGEVGQEQPVEQVQVVEIRRRKLIVNPFSPVSLEQPDELEIEVEELTERLATAQAAGGEGQGEGGYEGGAGTAFTFVALQHAGRRWDEATRTTAASKFLQYFRTRTGVKTKPRPLELAVGNLVAQDDDDQQPALLYLCFDGSDPRFSRGDVRFLRRYVEEIGGVILIDAVSGGARRRADELARELFGSARWRAVGRDDPLMTGREQLGELSDQQLALAAHDGRHLLGIRASDGQWALLYHPGDLVDAWRGAYDSAWQETGFKLGVNIADHALKRFTRQRRAR